MENKDLDWNKTMKDWKRLYSKILLAEKNIRKTRRPNIDKNALLHNLNDLQAAVMFEIRRVNIKQANFGISETKNILKKDKFKHFV